MATLKRGDILRKNTSRGRPPKPEKERQQKQRQAYQWRDARRVYLAASFERWRKLRARLQLKDSSLAWHLLETHDKGCDKCNGRHNDSTVDGDAEGGATSVMDVHVQEEKDASKFFPGVRAALRQLCHAHLQFEDCVELVGLLCVEIDHRRKDNFSLQEVVRRGTQPKARAHERDQTELEADQAQAVAMALSRHDLDTCGGKSQFVSRSDLDAHEDSVSANESTTGLFTAGSQDNVGGVEPAHMSDRAEPGLDSTELTETHIHNTAGRESCVSLAPHSAPSDQPMDTEVSRSSSERDEPKNPGTGDVEVPSDSCGVTQEGVCMKGDVQFENSPLTGLSHVTTRVSANHSPVTAADGRSPVVEGRIDTAERNSQRVAGISNTTSPGSVMSDSGHQEEEPHHQTNIHHQAHRAHRQVYHREHLHGTSVSLEGVAPPRVVVSPDGVVHVPRACGVTGEVYRIDLSGESRDDFHWPASSRHSSGEDRNRSYEDRVYSNSETEASSLEHVRNVTPDQADAAPMEWEEREQSLPSSRGSADQCTHYEVVPSQSGTSYASSAAAVAEHVMKSETPGSYRSEAPAPESTAEDERGSATSTADVPLDMSVVKEEAEDEMAVDYQQDRHKDAQGQISHNSSRAETMRNVRPASVPLDTSLGSTSTLHPRRHLSPSPGIGSAGMAYCDSGRPSRDSHHPISSISPPVSASSMQLLQNYTERLMQQRLAADIPAHLSARLATPLSDAESGQSGRKRRLSEVEERAELSGVSPWPRKDMTQKPEYQFLETDPFIDFGEMSRIYPSMQQRTFYRWKRRIKDQIIFLEQRPHLTYSQFSAFFPHVKENVFHHWRGLIARGQRFLADSSKTVSAIGLVGDSPASLPDSGQSARGSGGGSGEERGEEKDDHTTQFIFLQKNIGLDWEQFSQVYPDVPRHLFHTWKKQILSDFLKLQTNPQISYQEFRKQAPVTQDVFSLWKTQVALLNGGSPVTSSCLGLASLTPSSLSTMAPTLPPMSLLAARQGVKNVSAELAAWYSSYAPLMGLSLWPPLGMMPGASLPPSTITANLRELNEERERTHDHAETAHQDSSARSERETTSDDISYSRDDAEDEDADVTGDAEGVSGVRATSPHVEGSMGAGSGYRGRRQSLKPEHYHFLLHPDTSYTALCRIYPGVSVQRYGRWRRKVASALSLLERQPLCTAEQFSLYFPNVPDEILESWRQRVKQGLAQLPLGSLDDRADPAPAPPTSTTTPTSPSSAPSGRRSRDSSLSADNVQEEMPNFLMEGGEGSGPGSRGRIQDTGPSTTASPASRQSASSAGSTRKQIKLSREEYHFVQRYPKVDFVTFTTYYPTVSIRTFYRWRRQVREGISLLRSHPSIGGADFRKVFPDVSDDVLDVWRVIIREEEGAETTATSDQTGDQYNDHPTSPEEQVDVTGVSRDQTSPAANAMATSPGPTQSETEAEADRRQAEQWLLHMNPYLDYVEFCRTYPGVSQRTFYRWKQEVQQVMHYMRTHPDVRYDDIAAVLPDISRDAFLLWRQLIATEVREARAQSEGHGSSGGHGDSAETPASDHHHHRAATVTSDTAYTARATAARGTGSSSDHRGFESSHTLDRASEVAGEAEEEEGGGGRGRRQIRDEFVHVMLNPAMDYTEFSIRFGTVSQRTYYRWRRHIREWRALIRANPDMDYATFSRSARDVPESVFRVWREWECGTEQQKSGRSHADGQETSLQAVASSLLSEGQSVREGVSASSPAYPFTSQSSGPPPTEEVSLDGQPREDSPDDNTDSESHQVAYQYFLRQPEMTFDDLAAHFPVVAPRTFYGWKKSAEMKLEYIRSIPSTNFADFHNLFPDVPEDVFNIWKAKVLSEPRSGENFLFPMGDDQQAIAGYPSQMSAPFATPLKQQDSQSTDTDTSSRRSPCGSPVQQAYGSGTALTSQPQGQRVSPAPAHEGEKPSSETTLNIKREADTTPLPSFTETVSNLSRLSAMLHHHLPHNPAPPVQPHLPPVDPHTSVITGTPGLADFSTALATVVGRTLADNASGASLPHHLQHHQQALDMAATHASADGAAYSSALDVRTARANADARAVHEEKAGEANVYSSQRQRKMHRVEYMFVEKSPDVDLQEFLRHFPGVSPRTFYRWKREIREEQQTGGSST